MLAAVRRAQCYKVGNDALLIALPLFKLIARTLELCQDQLRSDWILRPQNGERCC